MSYKTDRLTALFPEAYAAGDRESLLYKLLDAVGAEFMDADEAIKRLLKSHWVDYAEGAALDGLAAAFAVSRRRLRGGDLEGDVAFRRRLKSIVPLFAGGGTRRAVIGAVRSALGLPFDLDQLNLGPQYAALRRDIEALIRLEEFSPKGERILGSDVSEVLVDGRPTSEVLLEINLRPPGGICYSRACGVSLPVLFAKRQTGQLAKGHAKNSAVRSFRRATVRVVSDVIHLPV